MFCESNTFASMPSDVEKAKEAANPKAGGGVGVGVGEGAGVPPPPPVGGGDELELLSDPPPQATSASATNAAAYRDLPRNVMKTPRDPKLS